MVAEPRLIGPYAPLERVLETAASLGRAEVYGRSAEGRELLAIELPGEGPTVMVTAGIHGLEFIGVHTALEVLRGGLLPGARLVVCPVLNPDAYASTARGERRRTNARGVDLNRNFPLPYGARPSRYGFLGAGSKTPGDATYRGPGPGSEAEVSALAGLVEARRPHASANLHSFLGTLFCARVWHPSDWLGYRSLARAFRAGQGTAFGYPRLGTPVFDVFTGELEDWQHHVMRCWAVCVECFSLPESFRQGLRNGDEDSRGFADLDSRIPSLRISRGVSPARVLLRSPDPFWRFNPRDPEAVAMRDAAGVRAMLAASVALERPPDRPGADRCLPTW